jgi:hypothetical protein
MCNTSDCWVFELCPWCSVLKNTVFRKLNLFPSSGEERETFTLLNPLERLGGIYSTLFSD